MHMYIHACVPEHMGPRSALNSLGCVQSLNQCHFSVPHKIVFPELIVALSGALSLPK